LIIIDRQGSKPKVLMGRRHDGHKFMPGKFVFPGGRLERSDRFMSTASELTPATEARLSTRVTRRSDSRGRALALTALRETYEETGLVIGRKVADGGTRRAVPAGWEPFVEAGTLPDLAAITFVGRAITPPRRPKRFDTRFFTVDRDHVCAEVGGFVGPDKELVELAWVDLVAAKSLELPRITGIMLEELEHRFAEGFPQDAPVPFYREERGRFLRDLL
jgi:8-oxo-dGTP pyrophosphatase MutT (NUDIX family)